MRDARKRRLRGFFADPSCRAQPGPSCVFGGRQHTLEGAVLPLPEPGMQDPGLAPPKSATGLRRVVYVVLGLLFLGLATVGVFTPVLPTTPFLLLAAWFFARSSARLHAWLLRSRLFGGMIRDWQKHRGVRPRVKVVALTLLPLVVFTSAYFGNLPWYLVTMLIVLATIGAVVVIRLPLVREPPPVVPLPETETRAGGEPVPAR